MNNVKQNGIKVELDKERTLLFDLNAFCELEEAYGDINKAFKELEKMSFKAIRKLLHTGLIHEDEKLTEKQVGNMLSIENLADVANKLVEAFSQSMPEEKGNKSKNK